MNFENQDLISQILNTSPDFRRRLRLNGALVRGALRVYALGYIRNYYPDPMAWFVYKFGKKRGEELYHQAVRQNTA